MSNFVAKITISAIDKVSSVVRSVSSSLDKLKVRTSALSSSYKSLTSASDKFSSSLKSIVFGVAAVGGSIFALTKRTADMGENLLNAAQRAGVSVEELQKLRYAAEIAGIDIGDMDNALKFLNKSIAEASTNSKSDAAKAFKSMGISIKDASGQLKSADVIFKEMSDKFKSAPDGAKKVATAFATMSRAGTTLIPVLNLGSKAIQEQGKELERLGGLMTKEAAEKADAVGDNLQKLGFVFRGLGFSIASELMPAINEVVISFTNWYTQNKEFVKVKVTEYVRDFIKGVKELSTTLKNIYRSIQPVIEALGGFTNIIKILVGVYIAKLIISFAYLVIAFASVTKAIVMFSATLLATPLGWFLAAIAGIAVAAYLIYKNWEPIKAFFTKVWASIKAVFVNAWESITGTITSAFDTIKAVFDSVLTIVSGTAAAALKPLVVAFAEAIIAPFRPVIAIFDTVIKGIVAVKNAFSSVPTPNLTVPNIKQPIKNAQALNNEALNNEPIAGTRFAPAIQAQPSLNAPAAQNNRLAMLATPQQQQQKLDITMKIDAEGRAKDVKAKSNAPIDFTANTGVLMP